MNSEDTREEARPPNSTVSTKPNMVSVHVLSARRVISRNRLSRLVAPGQRLRIGVLVRRKRAQRERRPRSTVIEGHWQGLTCQQFVTDKCADYIARYNLLSLSLPLSRALSYVCLYRAANATALSLAYSTMNA